MTTVSDWTPEQVSVARDQTSQLRALARQMASVVVTAKVLQFAIDSNGGLRDLVTALDNGQIVPNYSGLAGAQSSTKAELAGMVAILDAYVTGHDVQATRELWARLGGTLAGLD